MASSNLARCRQACRVLMVPYGVLGYCEYSRSGSLHSRICPGRSRAPPVPFPNALQHSSTHCNTALRVCLFVQTNFDLLGELMKFSPQVQSPDRSRCRKCDMPVCASGGARASPLAHNCGAVEKC
jgi:hypothetical protein